MIFRTAAVCRFAFACPVLKSIVSKDPLKQFVTLVIKVFFPFLTLTDPQEASTDGETDAPAVAATIDTNLNDFLWGTRPVIVFADSPADPRFKKQMYLLEALPDKLHLRDVVVINDTDPVTAPPLREKLRPRGFMLVLIGKDGSMLLCKPSPWNVRDLTRSIDKLPARQQEMRGRRNAAAP